jgi:heme A synthase
MTLTTIQESSQMQTGKILGDTMSPLSQKEWNLCLDQYLIKGEIEIDSWCRMDDEQKWLINELKKSFKRIDLQIS